MSQDTIVTGSKLTAIANSIRAKGGTSAQLTLDQMPQAVDDLPTGGGGFDWSQVSQIRISQLADQQTTIDTSGMDTATFTSMADMFKDLSALQSIDLSGLDCHNVTATNSMFSGCNNLTSCILPEFDYNTASAVFNANSTFSMCSSLVSIDGYGFMTPFRSCGYMFRGCASLTSVNLSNINTLSCQSSLSMFSGCSALTDIIWSQRDYVQPLGYAPSQLGITSQMKFYVPDNLVSAYKSASNWSTIESQIYSINDLPASVAALYAGHY